MTLRSRGNQIDFKGKHLPLHFGKRNFVWRVFTKKTVLSAKQQLYNFTDPLNPGGLAYNGKDAKSFPQFFPSCLKSWINFFLQFQQMSQNRNLVCNEGPFKYYVSKEEGGWGGQMQTACAEKK